MGVFFPGLETLSVSNPRFKAVSSPWVGHPVSNPCFTPPLGRVVSNPCFKPVSYPRFMPPLGCAAFVFTQLCTTPPPQAQDGVQYPNVTTGARLVL